MIRNTAYLLAIFILTSWLGCDGDNVSCDSGNISFVFKAENGLPLSGVLVTVGVNPSRTTDANGSVAFQGIPAGNQQLTVSRTGYEVVSTPNGETVTVGCEAESAREIIMRINGPVLEVSRRVVDFGSSSTVQTIRLSNSGTGRLTWSVSQRSDSWIRFIPSNTPSGDIENGITDLTISVVRDDLPEGTTEGQFTLEAGSAGTIIVDVLVERVCPFETNIDRIDFGPAESEGSFRIQRTLPVDFEYTISSVQDWICITPQSGQLGSNSSSNTIRVEIKRNLIDNFGISEGEIAIQADGLTKILFITVEKRDPTAPTLETFPESLNFGESSNQLNLLVSNTGLGVLNWSVSCKPPWLSFDNSDLPGLSNGEEYRLALIADRSGLDNGTYESQICLESSTGIIKEVPVAMSVDTDNSTLSLGTLALYAFNGDANSYTRSGMINYQGAVNGAELSDDRNGNVESAYCLDGDDDFINITNPIEGNSDDVYSICFWMKNFTLSSSKNYVVSLRGSSVLDIYMEDGDLKFRATVDRVASGPQYPTAVVDESNVVVSDWTHIVCVYDERSQDGRHLQIYVDGDFKASASKPSGYLLSTDSGITSNIGSFNGSSGFWEGCIDDLRIYERGLNINEINNLFCLDNVSSECN